MAQPTIVDLRGGTLVPGFIDLHIHGGGGATFDDGGAAIDVGLAAHRAHGTTRSLVSLVTAPMGSLTGTVRAVAEAVAGRSDVLGLHLEGPFLSAERRGVHNPAALIDPLRPLLDALLEAGSGLVRVVTIAPEQDRRPRRGPPTCWRPGCTPPSAIPMPATTWLGQHSTPAPTW